MVCILGQNVLKVTHFKNKSMLARLYPELHAKLGYYKKKGAATLKVNMIKCFSLILKKDVESLRFLAAVLVWGVTDQVVRTVVIQKDTSAGTSLFSLQFVCPCSSHVFNPCNKASFHGKPFVCHLSPSSLRLQACLYPTKALQQEAKHH